VLETMHSGLGDVSVVGEGYMSGIAERYVNRVAHVMWNNASYEIRHQRF